MEAGSRSQAMSLIKAMRRSHAGIFGRPCRHGSCDSVKLVTQADEVKETGKRQQGTRQVRPAGRLPSEARPGRHAKRDRQAGVAKPEARIGRRGMTGNQTRNAEPGRRAIRVRHACRKARAGMCL